MIKLTDHLFNDEILKKVLNSQAIDENGLKKHDGYCSYVYEGICSEKPIILKISHSSRVSKEALNSELSFTHHLAEQNVSICQPITLPGDIKEVEDKHGGYFYSYLYQKVNGADFSERKEKNEKDLIRAGELLGQFHASAQQFSYKTHPARVAFTKRDFVNYKKIIPQSEEVTHLCFERIISELEKLPRNDSNFGMTHGDFHDGNILCDGDILTIIDFDDIEQGFFLNDVAVFIDACCDQEGKENAQWVDYVFSNFMKGYKKIFF